MRPDLWITLFKVYAERCPTVFLFLLKLPSVFVYARHGTYRIFSVVLMLSCLWYIHSKLVKTLKDLKILAFIWSDLALLFRHFTFKNTFLLQDDFKGSLNDRNSYDSKFLAKWREMWCISFTVVYFCLHCNPAHAQRMVGAYLVWLCFTMWWLKLFILRSVLSSLNPHNTTQTLN